jgi:hypothetical protein
VIGGETLQGADGYRIPLPADNAGILAEEFVLADAPADTGEGALFADDIVSRLILAFGQALNEALDVEMERTGVNAGGFGALEAALGLYTHLLGGESLRHLFG